jgi:hypothetical protein
MKESPMITTPFDPQTLADDLEKVRNMYAQFFATLDKTGWDKPVKGGPKEWTLHETVAHLVALNGDGLESVRYALRGETYIFRGLDTRYQFNAFNRKGIDDLLDVAPEDLCARLLAILDESARLARSLTPDQAEITVQLPIYNRPVRVTEALCIIMFHVGLFHTAQVAEPAGVPPLWLQIPPEMRHRVIGGVMRAFSLLYRLDIGGDLRDTIVFRVDGAGGGEWYVQLSPDAPASGEGVVEHPGVVVHLRDTSVFCQMLTGRLNLPLSLLSGALKLHGNLGLFFRMSTLTSVDAVPPAGSRGETHSRKPQLAGKAT